MGFGGIVIGDEILRGKRSDRHFEALRALLAARGRTLDWLLYVGDDRARLTETLRYTLRGSDVVFSFGGIGVTPDDHTRQAAAAAAGVALALHPEAEALIRARAAEMGHALTAERLELGHFPVGSRIIPNPVNRIPGFSFADHHFVPGFPQMAQPMVAWVLETYYPTSCGQTDEEERSLIVWHGLESELVGFMRALEAGQAEVKVFSLPSLGDATRPPHIELGVRGPAAAVARAMVELSAELDRRGLRWQNK